MPKIPGLGGVPVPMIPRTGLLPSRVTPLLVPRLSNYAQEITVKVLEYVIEGEPNIPAATLVPKLITGTTDSQGGYHESYMLARNGDPEGFMVIHVTPKGPIYAEICRMCGAAVEVYVGADLTKSFPQDSDAGYFVYLFPEE